MGSAFLLLPFSFFFFFGIRKEKVRAVANYADVCYNRYKKKPLADKILYSLCNFYGRET